MYDFSHFKKQADETAEWLKREFSGLRTGRATPAVLDGVMVESYGTMMSIKELASIGIEDPRTLRISPWDMSQVKAIEKAIQTSDTGLAVSVDDKGLRAIFPELSSERRQSLMKVAKQKLEDARVAIRGEREKVKEDIEAKKKSAAIGEDDKFRYLEELQKHVEKYNADLDGMFERKETEILG